MKVINRFVHFLFLVTVIFPTTVSGQSQTNYSGLKNKELVKCAGSSAEIHEQVKKELPGQGLPQWPGAGMPGQQTNTTAALSHVTILEDREKEVKGEITYNNFEVGIITVYVLNKKGEERKEIRSATYPVEASSGIIEFRLALTAGTAESTFLKSDYLRIVYSPKNQSKDKIFCYEMPKRWKIAPNNENVVVNIRPEPFGKAVTISGYNTMQKPGVALKTQNPGSANKKIGSSNKDTLDTDSQGISNQSFSLFEDFYTDYAFSNPNEISSIRLDAIFLDKNKNSGTYYFLPTAYNLAWTEEEGFKFTMLYGTGSTANDGNVNMTASLSCDITNREFEFISEIIKNHVQRFNLPFTEVKAILPVDPKISFQGNLQNYNISADKFSANVVSSVYEPITMAWTASTDATNEMITALGENIGITGNLVYSPGEGNSNVSIPMRLKLADKSTFGRLDLDKANWRSTNWRNKFPYTVRLKNLHVIVLHSDKSPCIYTWKLGEKQVPSRAQVHFDALAIPGWIDGSDKVLRMWMEYEVVPCKECDQEMVDMISSGTSGGKQRTVSFRSLGLLKRYGATYIKLQVRSRYFDPKGKVTMVKSVTLDRDEKDFSVGPFYVWNDRDLKYEFKLTLINEETSIEGTNWIGDNSMEVIMNKATAEKTLGANAPVEKK